MVRSQVIARFKREVVIEPLLNAVAAAAVAAIPFAAVRDLKPENILLTSSDSNAQLKVIDFGTSEFCKPGQRLSKKFGTPYYVAPEVRQVYIWGWGSLVWSLSGQLQALGRKGGPSEQRTGCYSSMPHRLLLLQLWVWHFTICMICMALPYAAFYSLTQTLSFCWRKLLFW